MPTLRMTGALRRRPTPRPWRIWRQERPMIPTYARAAAAWRSWQWAEPHGSWDGFQPRFARLQTPAPHRTAATAGCCRRGCAHCRPLPAVEHSAYWHDALYLTGCTGRPGFAGTARNTRRTSSVCRYVHAVAGMCLCLRRASSGPTRLGGGRERCRQRCIHRHRLLNRGLFRSGCRHRRLRLPVLAQEPISWPTFDCREAGSLTARRYPVRTIPLRG